MKRSFVVLALISATVCAIAAQEAPSPGGPSFSLSGAVAPRLSLSLENNDSAFANLPGGAPYSDTSAAGVIEGKLSFSRDYTSLGLLDFSFRDAALLGSKSGSTIESLSFTVNELYSDLNFGDLVFLRLGKQRLSWGTGFVFNPSDPVNPPKDPTARRATREGVPALKAEIIAEPVSLMAFAVLYDALEETGYGAKLSTSALPNADLSLSGYWSPSESWTAALNGSMAPLYGLPGWDSIQLWVEASLYGRARYRAFAPGALPGAAAAAEAAGGLQYAALAGASAQLPRIRTIALAEYYRLSEGLPREELSAVYRALRSRDPAVVSASSSWYGELARRPGRQASDYLFVSLSQPSITDSGDPILDKVGLSASCLANLVDGSFYASGGLSLAHVENTSVDLSLAWAQGGSESEFGNVPARLELGFELRVFF